MTGKFVLGLPAGQEPLLVEPACDCDGEHVHKYQHNMTVVGRATADFLGICTIAEAAGLVLNAASLVNPANAAPDSRDEVKRSARIIADIMEQVARGIRKRASE